MCNQREKPYEPNVGTEFVTQELQKLHEVVKRNLQIDSIGINNLEINTKTKEDIKRLGILETTSERIGNLFEIELLWKNEEIIIPQGKPTALHRLRCLERKIDNDDNLQKSI